MVKMAEKRDYYEVLDVERSASDAQISEAYRKLAMDHHPDRNPGDDEAVGKFKEAAEAFEVLGNAEKRGRYDKYGHAGIDGAGGGSPHFHDVGDVFEAFGDIFGDLFGGGGRSRGRRVRRGADVRCQVTIDLLEAAHGTSKVVKFNRHEKCAACAGSGAKPGTRPEACSYCAGRGRVVQSTGIFSMQTTCPSCQGAGSVVRDPCLDCNGVGYVPHQVTRKVSIPAGVDDQTQLRLTGEGEPSPAGGRPGDCYVVIRVTEHALFQRQGQHIICQVPITYSQAALGATIEVPTLDGREEVDVPPGTQTGEILKLSGRGVPSPSNRSRGDLIVQFFIEVPKKLGAEHERLLRELAEVENSHVSPQRKSFFKQLKEYFQAD